MAAIPVPPHHGHDNGHHAVVVDVDPVDDLLRDLSLDTGSKKKDKKKPPKIHVPIEPEYEGYTLTRLSAPAGQKPTWARVGKLALPFSNAKLHKMAMDHRRASGNGPATDYKNLLINQQGIIDRLVAEKVRDERDHDAIWVLFDVQKNTKDIPQNFFRVIRETISIQVILRRQDRGVTSADQTTSSTAAAHSFGEIIDLTLPFEEKRKKDKKDKKSKGDHGDDFADDDLAAILDQLPSGQSHHNGNAQQHQQQHQHQEDAHARAQRERQQWEEEQAWREYWAHQRYQQQQQQQQQQQPPAGAIPVHGQQHGLPQAPVPPQAHANPFQPEVGHPAQYELPPTLPLYADNQAHNEYSARQYGRSPSRHRSNSRRRHRPSYTPSISSSQQSPRDDGFWSPPPDSDFTPPSTPDRDFAVPYSGMQRRHSTANNRYHQDRRTRYPDERAVIQPAVSYRTGRDYAQRYDRPSRRRPAIQHAATYDDYPGSRRPRAAITNYAEGWEDADYRPRRGDNGVDFLRDLQPQRRSRRQSNAGFANYGVADPFIQ